MTLESKLVKDLKRGDILESILGKRFRVTRVLRTGELSWSKRGVEEELIEVCTRPLSGVQELVPHYWHADRPISIVQLPEKG